jgi:hypothetical protein
MIGPVIPEKLFGQNVWKKKKKKKKKKKNHNNNNN